MDPSPSASAPAASREGRFFYGWWIVLSGLLANFAYAEQFNSTYGVFVHHIGSEMGWSRTALAGVQTLSRFPEAAVASFLGPFIDRHGTRWIMGLGGLVMSASFFACATIDELWQLYLYKGIVMAVGAMCVGGFIGVTVSNWFVARRGRAMGFISMGSSLATATMPLFGAFIIENWGWRAAWMVMGVIVLVLTLPAVILVRRRPEDVGLHPDGLDPSLAPTRPVSQREARRRRELLAADVVWTRRQVLRTPLMWIMVFAWGLAGLSVTATNLHLIPFVLDLGYPLGIAAGAVSVRATAMLIGAPIWGFAVDRVPINAAASGQFACKAVSMLLFLLAPTPVGLVAALLLYGIGNAGSSVVQETIWANYYGRISLGMVRGIVYPLQTFLAAFGPLLMGVLYDTSGSYDSSWAILAAGFVVASLLILQSRPPKAPTPVDRVQEPREP